MGAGGTAVLPVSHMLHKGKLRKLTVVTASVTTFPWKEFQEEEEREEVPREDLRKVSISEGWSGGGVDKRQAGIQGGMQR